MSQLNRKTYELSLIITWLERISRIDPATLDMSPVTAKYEAGQDDTSVSGKTSAQSDWLPLVGM